MIQAQQSNPKNNTKKKNSSKTDQAHFTHSNTKYPPTASATLFPAASRMYGKHSLPSILCPDINCFTTGTQLRNSRSQNTNSHSSVVPNVAYFSK
jgi:hypothetical protein